MDFTLQIYKELFVSLKNAGYAIYPFNKYLTQRNSDKYVILRHDVDKRPVNSLLTARIENEIGIVGTYYFRSGLYSWNVKIVKEIASLGHEIGYHYENLSLCHGNIEKAILDFEKTLKKFREFVTIETVCMHGSPMSKYDNRTLWEKFDYRDFQIIGEPYFDIDFSETFYLTDTGRKWDGYNVSKRDKIPGLYEKWKSQGLVFRSTKEIMNAIYSNTLPNKIMINVHPQRWNNNVILWGKELVFQNLKNIIKKGIIQFS